MERSQSAPLLLILLLRNSYTFRSLGACLLPSSSPSFDFSPVPGGGVALLAPSQEKCRFTERESLGLPPHRQCVKARFGKVLTNREMSAAPGPSCPARDACSLPTAGRFAGRLPAPVSAPKLRPRASPSWWKLRTVLARLAALSSRWSGAGAPGWPECWRYKSSM